MSARLRTALADRRVLLLLDNATRIEQVLPLLPAGRGCAVVVTSRRRLSTLDASGTVRVGALPVRAAVELLARFVGAARVAAEPAGAVALAEVCGRMPLALRIAAARLADRPRLGLAEFAARVVGSRRPLDELTLDGLSVRDSLRADHDRLTASAARAFLALGRLTGALPAPAQVTPAGLAAAADLTVAQATGALDELADAQLVEFGERGEYLLPALPRLLATELAAVGTGERGLGTSGAVSAISGGCSRAS